MKQTTINFILTFLAGISTMLGIIPTYLNKKYKDQIISLSLSFSAGVLLSISLLSLIKEAINYLYPYSQNKSIFIYSLGIILITLFITNKINNYSTNKYNNKLKSLGILSLISLTLHNIFEGIISTLSLYKNQKLGIKLLISIAIHNIPEGITISVPIYYSDNNRRKCLILTFISGISEFIGAIISYIFLKNIITNFYLGIILLITAGIMIYTALFELLPTSLTYKKKKQTILFFLIGIIFINFII